MNEEQLLKLVMEAGPESAGMFNDWVLLNIFKDATTVIIFIALFFIIYIILNKIIRHSFDSRIIDLRRSLLPNRTGPIDGNELYQMDHEIKFLQDIKKLRDKWENKARDLQEKTNELQSENEKLKESIDSLLKK